MRKMKGAFSLNNLLIGTARPPEKNFFLHPDSRNDAASFASAASIFASLLAQSPNFGAVRVRVPQMGV